MDQVNIGEKYKGISSNSDFHIINDFFIIKNIFWSKYDAYKDFYSEYILKLYEGKQSRVQELGMVRNALILISEIVMYVDKVDTGSKPFNLITSKEDGGFSVVPLYISVEDHNYLINILDKIRKNKDLNRDEFDKCFVVFTEFMFLSGMSNLNKVKDVVSANLLY